MPTTKQQKLAHTIIENSGLNKPLSAGKMLENVGYSRNVACYPKRIINNSGVKTVLDDAGFTENNANRRLWQGSTLTSRGN